MPARVIGPITKHLDATGLLLDMAERETAIAARRRRRRLGRDRLKGSHSGQPRRGTCGRVLQLAATASCRGDPVRAGEPLTGERTTR